MAYSDFTLEQLETQFAIKNQIMPLFEHIVPIVPSDKLKDALQLARELPIRTEKAKSEAIVFPILIELRQRNNNFFTIYSGDNLNADETQGLKGECDFILSKDTHSFNISYPILQIVEAKKNNLESGVAQCAAQLLGAKIFNSKKGINLDAVYGCVTTADEWLFIKLEQHLLIDNRKYYLNEIEQVLAIFQTIIHYYQN